VSQGSPEILIVHDDLFAAAHLTEQLAGLGYDKVSAVTDSLQALRTICERRPSLILASVTLPGMDGYGFCRILKLPLCEGSDRIPVILTSALPSNSGAQDVARNMQAFALLPYPCESESLHTVIRSALKIGSRAEPHNGGFYCAAPVLIVSADLGDTLAADLCSHGWDAVAVPGAAPAKETLERSDFQLVLLDDAVNSARRLLAWIKAECRNTSVIVLTDAADSESLILLTAQKADDILRKPLDLGSVHAFCTGVLNRENFLRIQRQTQEQIQQLRAVNDYFDMVIRYSQEAIFSCDLVGRVRIWNQGAEKMYGYTGEEIVGGIVDDFLDPPDFTRKSPDVVRILRQKDGSFSESEVLRRKKSGEIFPVHATYSAILNADREYIGFSVIERDVATHKALEAEKIKSARLRAITQTAVTANDQINTPLGVILGYAQFLERKMTNLAPEDLAALEIIQQQVLKIKGIMNKLKLMSDPIVKNYSIEGVTMLDLSQSK
jgi:PAS domain S-box-containing protein